MKTLILFLIIFATYGTCFSQERFLNYSSKDSINNEPKVKGSIGVNLKLNGYYDIFGGLQDSETFNVGAIDVFGTDDSGKLSVDLYQTQVHMEANIMTKKGDKIDAVVEFDFWGGNGRMRLRKAYVTSSHWFIGQTFVPYGDNQLWPNIMEWEGPPSGVWVRSPFVSYFNAFKNKNWSYEVALLAPIVDYDKYGEVEPTIQEANQTTPDFTAAFKYQKEWGHIRLASIFRNVNYSYNNEIDNFFGYGLALSGMHMHNRNNFQFQLTAGKGVSAYNTSVQGFGHDGFPSISNEIEATPSYGGWLSYELYYGKKWHSTFVFGATRYYFKDVQRTILTVEPLPDIGLDLEPLEDITLLNGSVDNFHYYGIANLMYDPIERLTLGIEMDYGRKYLSFDGHVNDEYVDEVKKRDAMRISFGFIFKF